MQRITYLMTRIAVMYFIHPIAVELINASLLWKLYKWIYV